MNLRKLRREFGSEVTVSRDRKTGTVRAQACGLGYRATESAFKDERELAEFVRSKMPVQRCGGGSD